MTLRGAFIYYLVMAGVGLSALAQILNFAAGGPRNWRRWTGLGFGIIAAMSVFIAGQLTKQDLEWRRVRNSQETILSKQLEGTHAVGHFIVLNHQDLEQGQFFMSIAGVCIKLNILCYLDIQKRPYPAMFPPPGMLSFQFRRYRPLLAPIWGRSSTSGFGLGLTPLREWVVYANPLLPLPLVVLSCA